MYTTAFFTCILSAASAGKNDSFPKLQRSEGRLDDVLVIFDLDDTLVQTHDVLHLMYQKQADLKQYRAYDDFLADAISQLTERGASVHVVTNNPSPPCDEGEVTSVEKHLLPKTFKKLSYRYPESGFFGYPLFAEYPVGGATSPEETIHFVPHTVNPFRFTVDKVHQGTRTAYDKSQRYQTIMQNTGKKIVFAIGDNKVADLGSLNKVDAGTKQGRALYGVVAYWHEGSLSQMHVGLTKAFNLIRNVAGGSITHVRYPSKHEYVELDVATGLPAKPTPPKPARKVAKGKYVPPHSSTAFQANFRKSLTTQPDTPASTPTCKLEDISLKSKNLAMGSKGGANKDPKRGEATSWLEKITSSLRFQAPSLPTATSNEHFQAGGSSSALHDHFSSHCDPYVTSYVTEDGVFVEQISPTQEQDTFELHEEVEVKTTQGHWCDARIVRPEHTQTGKYGIEYFDVGGIRWKDAATEIRRIGDDQLSASQLRARHSIHSQPPTVALRQSLANAKPRRPSMGDTHATVSRRLKPNFSTIAALLTPTQSPKTFGDWMGSWDAWVSHVGSGHMLVRDSDGRYLISHRDTDLGTKVDDWMYPGGVRDNVDDEHIETAKREFFEETGAAFPEHLCVSPPAILGSRLCDGGGKHIVFFAQLSVPMSKIPGLKSDKKTRERNGAQVGGPIDQVEPYREDAECNRWAAVTTQELRAMNANLRKYCEEYLDIADKKVPFAKSDRTAPRPQMFDKAAPSSQTRPQTTNKLILERLRQNPPGFSIHDSSDSDSSDNTGWSGLSVSEVNGARTLRSERTDTQPRSLDYSSSREKYYESLGIAQALRF